MRAAVVLATVQLDDQACAEMDKVDYIRAERLLPTKFLSIETTGPQMTPQQALGIYHGLAQLSDELLLLHDDPALLRLIH